MGFLEESKANHRKDKIDNEEWEENRNDEDEEEDEAKDEKFTMKILDG